MKKTIEIIVSPHGTTRIEAHGFVGGSCKEATLPAVRALIGSRATMEVDKVEMHSTSPIRVSVDVTENNG